MKKDESHAQAVRERLKILLSTYQKELKVSPIQAETGETVIEQGGEADAVVLLKHGTLVVELKTEGEAPRQIATVEPGEILGEMGLFGDNRYSASIRVKEGPAELLFFDSASLMKFALFDSELVMAILALSSHRCHTGNHLIELLLGGLQALNDANQEKIDAICQDLEQESEAMKKAAKQIKLLSAIMIKGVNQ
jgi:CRP-like cAMP-binding protein